MHIFPAIISKLRCDVIGNLEAQRDFDVTSLATWKPNETATLHSFINVYMFTLYSDSCCFEASVRMVYCVAFGCNANYSKKIVTYSSFKFPMQPNLLKK